MEETKQRIRDVNRVTSEPPLSESDFAQLEGEIKDLNDITAKLAEKRLLKNK